MLQLNHSHTFILWSPNLISKISNEDDFRMFIVSGFNGLLFFQSNSYHSFSIRLLYLSEFESFSNEQLLFVIYKFSLCFFQVQSFYKEADVTDRVRINSSTVETNVTYNVTDDSDNVTLGLPEWQTIVVGTKQVRHVRYIDRMNVLGMLN